MAECRTRTVIWLALIILPITVGEVSAASQCVETAVAQSAAERFDAAKKTARVGDHDCARQLYARLMFDEPDNVDYIFGYAQVLHWSGDDARALRFLLAARTLAPGYEDIWKLEAQVRETIGDEAMGSSDFVQAARRQFPDALWIPTKRQLRSRHHYWSVSARRDVLSTDLPDWQELGEAVNWQLGPRLRAGLTANQSRRFDKQDQQWGAGIGFELTEHWSADFSFAASPSADHLAQRDYSMDVSRRNASGWAAHVRIRDRQFFEGTVHSAGLAVERYFGAFRMEYAFGNAFLDSDRAANHRVVVERYLASGSAIGMVAAVGEEIEFVEPGQLLRSDTRSFVVTLKHALGSSLTVGWILGAHEQGDFYRRIGLGVSLSGAF